MTGVPEETADERRKRMRREIIKANHPDHGGDPDRLIEALRRFDALHPDPGTRSGVVSPPAAAPAPDVFVAGGPVRRWRRQLAARVRAADARRADLSKKVRRSHTARTRARRIRGGRKYFDI